MRSFVRKRGFDQSYVDFPNDHFVLLNSAKELEQAAAELDLSSEEKLISTFWHLDDDERIYLPWVSSGFLMLFFAWIPVLREDHVDWQVSGVRLRQIFPTSSGPKEVALSTSGIDALSGTPSTMGFFGHLNYIGNMYTPVDEIFGFGRGQTIVLTEGCTDMMAAKILLARETERRRKTRKTTVISTGQIQTAFWPCNLSLIRNCDRLIIAFNNDSQKTTNTGQENAERLRKRCIELGFKRVEELPPSTLEGCNDINDLLRKRYPNSETPTAVSAFTSFIMED
jgi:hypothetical protein